MEHFETVWIKKEEAGEVSNEPGSMRCKGSAMVHYETVWIKAEEADEVPNESESTVQVQPPSVNIKEDKAGSEEFGDDPLGISCSHHFISEEPEVMLQVDEAKNIVVTSTRYVTDNTRLITTGDICGTSFEERKNQEVVPEDLEKGTEWSPDAPTCGTRVPGVTSEEESVIGTRLKCCLKEKEFNRFVCSSCLQSFPSKYRLTMHVFIHTDGVQPPAFVCKSCGEVFPSNVSLDTHLRMSGGDEGLSAGSCEETGCIDEVFVTGEIERQSSCKETMKLTRTVTNDVEEGDNYETFPSAGNVNDRAVQLTIKRLHGCDVCGKSFTQLSHLKSHMLKHTGLKPYKCDVCGKSFTQVGTLNRHTSTHTGKTPHRPHKCGVCGKCFTQLIHLKNHALTHTGMRPHKCDVCGKCFTQSVALQRHALTHTGIRPHKCDICGKSFTLLGDLKRHSLIHAEKAPNKCDVCGKSFARLDYLKVHVLQHTGMSPHKCVICDKSFAQLCTLKNHVLKHTGLKPYKCEICGKSFTELGTLQKHALKHIEKT